jgi:hypothetical protein
VQARTRTLAAPVFGDHSRVLPASMVLPNEEVPAMTIWGGIPGVGSPRAVCWCTLDVFVRLVSPEPHLHRHAVAVSCEPPFLLSL